jgi:Transposase
LPTGIGSSSSRLCQVLSGLAQRLGTHFDGVLAWTETRVTNGALEGINNKVKVISHPAYGYRSSCTYIASVFAAHEQYARKGRYRDSLGIPRGGTSDRDG